MIDMTTAPFGALILRLALAFLFFAHVYLKLFIFKPAGTVGFFKSLGLPGWFAYVTIVWRSSAPRRCCSASCRVSPRWR